MKLSFLFAGLLAIPFTVGCSSTEGSPGTSESEFNLSNLAAGSFKLYGQPRANPSPDCDLHTLLDLSSEGGFTSKAHLEERLMGSCEMVVPAPNKRDYKLELKSTSCGSELYVGSFGSGADKHSIEVVDNRHRICEDMLPALIVVRETVGDVTTTLYSRDDAPASQVVIEGTLAAIMAVGGETSGYGLRSASGLHELVLDRSEAAQFSDGAKARVKGNEVAITGVEIPVRRAIDVTELLVCPSPGWVNCMPGDGIPTACKMDNREWIEANCSGVSFAD